MAPKGKFQLSQNSSSVLKMRSLPLYSLATVVAHCSALAVPLNDGHQSSIGVSRKHGEDYDLDPSATFSFAGITTFARLPQVQCLQESGPVDDILLLGFPFDTATSFRTGTRFGPNAIRQGSRAASLALAPFEAGS